VKPFRSTIVAALTLAILGTTGLNTEAQTGPIRVLVNGEEARFDVPPVEIGGRLLVPLRGVFERLGANVRWEPAAQRITATTSAKTIELVVGQRDAAVDGKPVVMDVPPMVIQGRTMVPLRFVSEALGAFVQWQAATRTVSITLPVAEPAPPGYRATPAAPTPAQPTPAPTPAQPTPPPATPVPTPAVATPPGVRVTEGVLVAVNTTATPPRIQVGVGQVIYVFQITRETAILRFDVATGGGGSVALSALRTGDQTRVETSGASTDALSVRASFRLVRGRVDVMTFANIALQDGQVIRINSDAVVTLNGAAVPLAEAPSRIRRGDEIVLRLNPATNEAWELTATSLAAATPAPSPTAVRTPAGGRVTFIAIASAPLFESAATVPHPGEVLLVGRDASGRFRSLIGFNISAPPGTVVRRARLRLFMYWIRSGGTDLYSVYPVTRAWNEASATWGNMAGRYDSGRGAGPVMIAAGAQRAYFEWDVSDIVREWVTGASPNYGLLVRNLELGLNVLHFGHRDDVAANRPQLMVEFGPP
jgi:hypothetical protein